MKASPCRELAVEYLFESTNVWSGTEAGGGETRREGLKVRERVKKVRRE